MVYDLVVKEIKDKDGKIIDVKIRNRPSSHESLSEPDDPLAGRQLGEVKAGTQFSRGILVDGTDPKYGGLRTTHDSWIYVSPENNPQSGGFIHKSNLEYTSAVQNPKASRLKSFSNP